jgi:hypothetical protein
VTARRGITPPYFEVLDDGGKELDDLVLLTTRQLGDLVEQLPHFADGAAGARE